MLFYENGLIFYTAIDKINVIAHFLNMLYTIDSRRDMLIIPIKTIRRRTCQKNVKFVIKHQLPCILQI